MLATVKTGSVASITNNYNYRSVFYWCLYCFLNMLLVDLLTVIIISVVLLVFILLMLACIKV